MNDLLKLAPTILSFLTNPAGGIAGAGLQWLAGKLGASDATAENINKTLQGWSPEDTIKLRQIDIDFQKFAMDNGIKIDLAQIAVNEKEAENTDWFVAGWRTAIGWICGLGLLYSVFVEPIFRFIAVVIFDYAGTFPVIDTSITMQILVGMLGLAGLRSYDKKQGTDTSTGFNKGK